MAELKTSPQRRRGSWLLAPLGLLILIAAVTVGAAATAASAAEERTLEVVSFYPEGTPDYENLSRIARSFEAKNPGVSVRIIFGGGPNAQGILARYRAGNPPEITGYGPTGVQGREFVSAGFLYDLTPALNSPLGGGYPARQTWRDSLLPAARPFLTAGGKYYAVPRELTVINFFYNRKIFARLKLTPPKTWAEFVTVSDRLKRANVTPLTVTGTFPGYMGLYYDYLIARRAGAAPVRDAIAGRRSFASVPGVLAAANDLSAMAKKGYFLRGFQGVDFTAAQLNFFQGRAAMILMGSWLVGEMKESIPPDFELGTFPFPQIPGGKGNNVLFGVTNTLNVAAQSKNPQLGVAFLKWMARKDIQAGRVRFLDYLSGYKGVAGGPKYAGVVSSLQSGGAFNESYWGLYGQTKSVRDAYQLPIVKLIFGDITPRQMVNEISTGLQSATR